ncbi:MAG: caspase family protein [Anaeromyxobacteraceae bacterium]|nr:caspase family protein [Anaeromyxobacteraceae bacterium]
MRRAAALALLAALLGAAAPAAAAEGRRFALVAGEAEGGPGTQRLRHAERDARRIHGILTRVGGVREEDAALLVGEGARAFRRALADLTARAAAARAAGERTLLVVYFSGHAKDGALRFGQAGLPLAELRDALQAAPADVRIGLLDACRSGAIARTKGVRPAPEFQVTAPGEAGPRGLVLITSSAADEDSQESDALGASYFTHSLASGLLGDADASGDGRVTLAEAYAHAYGRTVGATAGSAGGTQHPAFLYDLGGAGDVVLTELAPAAGGLLFPPELEGLYVVLDGGGRAVAEVAKPAGAARRLSLAPGRYTVKKRLPGEEGLLVASHEVGRQPVRVEERTMDRVPVARDPQKGWGGARFSLVSGLGGQTFFEPRGSEGLFPDTTLLGAELAARDDLGHGLAWGLDLSLGGASGSLRLPGLEPIQMRATEVALGASLWRDWALGRLTLSAGGRVAFLWLGRTFDAREQLPPQYFFTVTPGLTGAAAWRLGHRLSAVARVRVSWLFYNVDQNRSLGYADALLGVEYALSD